jgi:hypothetical protein
MGEEVAMREPLFELLVLVYPLAMLLMMRGGHGQGGHSLEVRVRDRAGE